MRALPSGHHPAATAPRATTLGVPAAAGGVCPVMACLYRPYRTAVDLRRSNFVFDLSRSHRRNWSPDLPTALPDQADL